MNYEACYQHWRTGTNIAKIRITGNVVKNNSKFKFKMAFLKNISFMKESGNISVVTLTLSALVWIFRKICLENKLPCSKRK